MASQWKAMQRFAERLVFDGAPRLIKGMQNPAQLQRNVAQGLQQTLAQALTVGIDVLVAAATEPQPAALTAGRPVTQQAGVPTDRRARRVVYAPDLDGRADPGEVVWTWVVYEDDPTRGKDRPVLVVGRNRSTLLGLMLSSQDHHADDPNWISIGAGAWDYDGRPSWVRLDRVLDVPEEGIRREGAILDRVTFETVAVRLRREYSWS
ncbi:type II toxin-antitoxin system PemK/MazF family toxin [Mycolicibacterium brumae]|uniref:Type II toxin-antitoxin system PemK/MazF family toxin n=1 Tax=Mycolicibacterium brumae TaxID=85968 RepID=A0A2G5P5S5_9MYCO|nr:type II toxin-antitoxin system PemK/MazF family toxin [Mycolicibacterium brumae]MCV7191544.1 type II toxin-antitoxin system PemK/MazF family toxin [Mycolicibacterium brumae]PIB73645.1 type II toxin-antitoxin system PemK/MazF family toxin [Mycolicibacterium brumae]UWW09347.1 type II toxin-antitoxin system PemK/MazF family toxin [Mycolicibacterium brumae]